MTVVSLITPRLKGLLAKIPRYIGSDEPPAGLSVLRYTPTAESREAADAIAGLGPDAVPEVLGLLPKVPEHQQHALVSALGQIGDERAVGPLCELVEQDDSFGMQLPALSALRLIASPESTPCLERHLDHQWDAVRTEALKGLIAIQGPVSLAGRLSGLAAQDRKILIEALVTCNDAKARPHLVEALEDPEAEIRRIALERLVQTESDEFVPRLVQCLSDPSETVSKLASIALRPHATELVELLVPLLESKVANQRNAAMFLLSRTDDPALVIRMGELLGKRSKKSTRISIINALRDLLPDEAAWSHLVRAVADETSDVKQAALIALAKSLDPAAIPILRDALMKPVAPYADGVIVKQLIRYQHPEATATLVDYVCSDLVAGTAFHEAVAGLVKLKARDALPRLVQRTANMANDSRKKSLDEAIQKLS